MGTLYYLAPERWQDAPADTDWRPSDQYAAGVTAFQILSNGQFPLNFQGADNYNLDSYQKIHAAGAKLPLVIPERSHKSTLNVSSAWNASYTACSKSPRIPLPQYHKSQTSPPRRLSKLRFLALSACQYIGFAKWLMWLQG